MGAANASQPTYLGPSLYESQCREIKWGSWHLGYFFVLLSQLFEPEEQLCNVIPKAKSITMSVPWQVFNRMVQALFGVAILSRSHLEPLWSSVTWNGTTEWLG